MNTKIKHKDGVRISVSQCAEGNKHSIDVILSFFTCFRSASRSANSEPVTSCTRRLAKHRPRYIPKEAPQSLCAISCLGATLKPETKTRQTHQRSMFPIPKSTYLPPT